MNTSEPRRARFSKNLGVLLAASLLMAAVFVAVFPKKAQADTWIHGIAETHEYDENDRTDGLYTINNIGELNTYLNNHGTDPGHYLKVTLHLDLNMSGRESIVIPSGRKVIFELDGYVLNGSNCSNSAFTLRGGATLILRGDADISFRKEEDTRHVGYFDQTRSTGKLWKLGTNSSKEQATITGGLVTGFKNHVVATSANGGSVELRNVTLAGNSNTTPVYLHHADSRATMVNSAIKWNYNTVHAGGIEAEEADYIQNISITLDNSSITENVGGAGGGIGIWRAAKTTIKLQNGSKVSNNYSTGVGGGIALRTHTTKANSLRDDSAYSDTSAIELSGGSEISGNVAESDGGGVYARVNYQQEGTSVRGARKITLKDGSKISNNQSNGNGGGIFAEYDERTDYPQYPYMEVHLEKSSEISSNKAKVGGGIYMTGSAWQQVSATLGSHIDGNRATSGNGGGLYLDSRLVDVSLTSASTINNNKACRSGGGIAAKTIVTMSMDGRSEVNGNEAEEAEGGGMVVWSSGSLNLQMYNGSQVAGNRAHSRGGGLSLACSGTCFVGYDETSADNEDQDLTRGEVSYNAVLATDQATAGGGIYCGTNVTLRNLDVKYNSLDSTTSSGGGLYVENRTATLLNCSVTNNKTAGNNGGGIEVHSSGAASRAELGLVVVVENNTNGQGAASDLHIGEKSSNKSDVERDNNQLNNRIFECGNPRLSEGSRIGLQHWTGTDATKHAVSVRGWRVDAPASYFFADDPTWRAVKTSGNEIWLENEPTLYNVNVITNIDAEAKTTECAYTSTVTLNSKDYMAYDVKPDYYSVDGLDGVKTLTPDSNGNVSFTMPANDVTLTAHYTPCITGISVEVEDPNDYTDKGDVPVNVSKIVLKDSAGGETVLTDSAEIAKIVASATRSHIRNYTWGAMFGYDVLLNPNFAEVYGFTFVESKVTERSMQATWSNGNVYSPTGFCHVDVKEDGKIDVNMGASVGKQEFTVTTKYIDVNLDKEISEKSWKVAQGDEFNLDASLLLSQWVFTNWGDLPEGVTQDGSKITINPVKGNVELTIYYKPVVTKIEIKVPELHVGEKFPYRVSNFDIYDSSNTVSWSASSVNNYGEFTWTRLNYRGEEVGEDDTVKGDWTTYRLKIVTSEIAGEKWQRSITDTFTNSRNDIRITVNGQTRDVQCVTDADGTSTITVLLGAVDNQAFDKVVTAFPTVDVAHAAACKDKVAGKVSYLDKSGYLHDAAITWDFSQVDDTMTSGEFTVKGTFTDRNGDAHEVKQTFSLIDLYAPGASPDEAAYEGSSVDVSLYLDSSFDGEKDAQIWYCVKPDGETPSADDYQLYEGSFAVDKENGKSQVVFAYAKVGERVTSVSAQSYLFVERHNVTVVGGKATDGENNVITSALENSDVFITADEPGEGQSFEGWKIEPGEAGGDDAAGETAEAPEIEDPSSAETSFYMGSSDVTVTAVFSTARYAVSFDAQGGSEVVTQQVEHGKTAVRPEDPTREGFAFEGWYADAACTTAYDFSAPVKADTTVYAKWKGLVTVSFDAAGGSAVENRVVAEGSALGGLPTTERTGYLFTGWYNGETRVTSSTVVDAAVTLTAHWKPISLEVRYVDGYNTLSSSFVEYDQVIKAAAAPAKVGHTFVGWFNDRDCTQAHDFSQPVRGMLVLYGRWDVNEYTVSFDVQGGSGVAAQTVAYGSAAEKPATEPVRAGYAFKGWYADADCIAEYNFVAAVTGDTTVYAKWVKLVTVSFDAAGGSEVAARTVEQGSALGTLPASEKANYIFCGWKDQDGAYVSASTVFDKDAVLTAEWGRDVHFIQFLDSDGETVLDFGRAAEGEKLARPEDPVREGYEFDGWYTSTDFSQKYDFENTEVHSDFDLYAKWSVATNTVSFDSQGGSAVATRIIAYGDTLVAPNEPTWAGHTFDGWYTDRDCTAAYNFDAPVKSSFTLYAKWTELVTVTFNAAGGSAVDPVTLAKGSAIGALPSTSLEGHYLEGWFDADGKQVTVQTTFDQDAELTARWAPEPMIVGFMDGDDCYDVAIVDYGNKVEKPADPTKVGYTFAGWFSNKACTIAYNFDKAVTSDFDVYAKWTLNKYAVTFSAGEDATNVPAAQTVEHGDKATKPATDPVRSGYVFKGWYADADCTTEFDFDAAVTGETTVYAKWVELVTITFDTDGGSEVAARTIEAGSALGELPVTQKANYVFCGWKDQDGTYVSAFTTFDKSAVLTADWGQEVYRVQYLDSDGEKILDFGRAAEGEKLVRPEDPTREGYTFDGWYTKDGEKYNFDAPVYSDFDLYAKWNINKYAVSFDTQGGSAVDAQTVEHGSAAVAPATDPTREGYAFKGWYADAACTEAYDFTAAVTGNVTVYAKWAKLVTITFDAAGGTAVDARTIETGAALGELPATSRDDYYFAGWRTQDGTLVSASTVFTKDATLTAEWGRDTFYVQFVDSDGETVLDFCRVAYGAVLTRPADPVREGYTFDGWYTGTDYSVKYGFDQPVGFDFELFAKWTKKTYTVTFSAAGAANVPAAQTVEHGDAATKPATAPTLDGLVFKGWLLGGKEYDFSTPVTGDITLEASWSASGDPATSCAIVFDAAGGTAVDARVIASGSALGSLPTTSREGYTFAGWYLGDEQITAGRVFTQSATLTAKWVANTYPVYFTDDGALLFSASAEYGTAVAEPAEAPAKTGRVFAGWYADKALTQVYDFSAPVTDTLTLYAKWETARYAVTFSAGEGATNVPAAQEVEHGEKAQKPAAEPERDGYVFKGWYADAACAVEFDFDAAVTGNMTAYAKWAKLVTITFDADGGTAVEPRVIEAGTALGELPVTKAENYVFLGWCDENDRYISASTVFDKDTTLTAEWGQDYFRVQFFDSDGKTVLDFGRVREGETLVCPDAPVREGYEFDGWRTVDGKEYDFENTPVHSDFDLYATWSEKTYRVTFSAGKDAAAATGMPADQTVKHSGMVAKPESDPACEGYAFKGWYADEACTVAFNFSQAVKADTTVYAKWAKLVTVTFDADGGRAGWGDENALDPRTVEAGEAIGTLPIPTKDGYKFMGWYLGDEQMSASTTLAGDATLTARWGANTYFVYYVDASSNSLYSVGTVVYGEKIERPADPVEQARDFGGYFADRELAQPFDFDGVPYGPATVFMKWTAKTYTVTFDSAGGSAVEAQVVEHGKTAAKPADPVLAGFTFGGWLLNGEPYDFSTPVTGDLELQASWASSGDPAVAVVVEFDSAGGSEVAPRVIPAGSALGELSVPEREGYVFDGWYAADGTQVTPETTFNESATLTARWVAKTYKVTFEAGEGAINVPAAQEVEHGKTVAKPADPVLDGYTFRGWLLDGEGYDFSTPVTGDLTLEASWEKDAEPIEPDQPVTPVEPDQPVTPSETPATPDAPATPAEPKVATESPAIPDAGDATSNAPVLVALAGAAAALLGTLGFRRRKE